VVDHVEDPNSVDPKKETIDALAHLDLPSGVDIEIKK
jgi:ribosomal protein S10